MIQVHDIDKTEGTALMEPCLRMRGYSLCLGSMLGGLSIGRQEIR
jgi:hypothetical protein